MTKTEIKALIARLTHENTTEKEEAEILNAIVDAMVFDARGLSEDLTQEQVDGIMNSYAIITDGDTYPRFLITNIPASLQELYYSTYEYGAIYAIFGNVIVAADGDIDSCSTKAVINMGGRYIIGEMEI